MLMMSKVKQQRPAVVCLLCACHVGLVQGRCIRYKYVLKSRRQKHNAAHAMSRPLLQCSVGSCWELRSVGSQTIPDAWLMADAGLCNDGLHTFCQCIWNVLCLRYQVLSPGLSCSCSCSFCSATGVHCRHFNRRITLIGSGSYFPRRFVSSPSPAC